MLTSIWRESAIMETTWKRCEPSDPNRCQCVTGKGQCINLAVEGSKFCGAHGGNSALKQLDSKNLSGYRLAKYQNRLSEFADSDKIKSLRDEIGILRILIEERFNYSCKTDTDLLLHSGPLSDLIMKVEKLVSSCDRIESKLGLMMDKTQIMQLATEVVEIISQFVTDEATLTDIATQIASAIDRMAQPKINESR
jgi:hypothetical protein